jgi:hypothetical protein
LAYEFFEFVLQTQKGGNMKLTLSLFFVLASLSAFAETGDHHKRVYITSDEVALGCDGLFLKRHQYYIPFNLLHFDAHGLYLKMPIENGYWKCPACGCWNRDSDEH